MGARCFADEIHLWNWNLFSILIKSAGCFFFCCLFTAATWCDSESTHNRCSHTGFFFALFTKGHFPLTKMVMMSLCCLQKSIRICRMQQNNTTICKQITATLLLSTTNMCVRVCQRAKCFFVYSCQQYSSFVQFQSFSVTIQQFLCEAF